jgi:hypothetical protein
LVMKYENIKYSSGCLPCTSHGLTSSEVPENPLGDIPEPVPDQGWDRCRKCVEFGLGATLTPYAVSVPRAGARNQIPRVGFTVGTDYWNVQMINLQPFQTFKT